MKIQEHKGYQYGDKFYSTFTEAKRAHIISVLNARRRKSQSYIFPLHVEDVVRILDENPDIISLFFQKENGDTTGSN